MTSSKISFTLDEILEDVKVSWFQYRLFVLCGLMFMADALVCMIVSNMFIISIIILYHFKL